MRSHVMTSPIYSYVSVSNLENEAGSQKSQGKPMMSTIAEIVIKGQIGYK